MLKPGETLDAVRAYFKNKKKPTNQERDILSALERLQIRKGWTAGYHPNYGKADLLDLELKYKRDEQVMDLIEDLKFRLEEYDDIESSAGEDAAKIEELEEDKRLLEEEVGDLKEDLKEKEREADQLDEENGELREEIVALKKQIARMEKGLDLV